MPTAHVNDIEGNGHEYSSTQFNLPKNLSNAIKKFQSKIPKEHLAEKGLEDNPHITVLYGLHTNKADDIKKTIDKVKPIMVKLGRSSIFNTPEADILKLGVESKGLHDLNKKMSEAHENTNEFPEYQPHVTIAYLKNGMGDKYKGKMVLGASAMKHTFDKLTFSPRNGEKTDHKLSSDDDESNRKESSGK